MSLLSCADKVYIAGHTGLAGSAILRHLQNKNYTNLIYKKHSELNLLDENEVKNFFENEKPDVVFLAAAKVGGINANNLYRSDFIYQNLQIQNNVIWHALKNNVHRLIFLGSSCVYPKFAPQPINENCLLTGTLEYTNQPYAIAKIAGIELVNSIRKQYNKDFFSVMPTNLFGPNDNYDEWNSHVIASLIKKFCLAKMNEEVVVWGDGSPLREFLHSDDLASAAVFLAEKFSFSDLEESILGKQNISHINIGSAAEFSILELAKMIASIVGHKGNIVFDKSYPNGTPRKILDTSFLSSLGWKVDTPFIERLKMTISSFQKSIL